MKSCLVTSQVTYIPDNYLEFLENIFKSVDIDSLICLKNIDGPLLKTALGLRLIGVKKISATLLKNIFKQVKDPRKALCEKYGINYVLMDTINTKEFVRYVKKQDIDLVINARTRFIYKEGALEAPRLGCINIHHGILPRYRGTMCDLHAMYEGRESGFSIHVMNKKIDDGNILRAVPVSKGSKNYPEYLLKSARKESQVLVELIKEIEELGALPEGDVNQCEDKCFTKNPKLSQIRKIIKEGVII